MRLFPLFASNLIEDRFEDEVVLDKLVNICDRTDFNECNETDRFNSSGSKSLTVLKKYPEIKNKILSYFEKSNELISHYPCKFDISTSWFTKTSKKGYSQFHSHRNSFYSGILYFGNYSEENKHAPIEFTSPISDLFNNYIIPKRYNINNCEMWKIFPNRGMILFFPSYLKHRIGYHEDDSIRYSLAFNIVPKGEYGIEDSYYNTDWF
jgi:uncharacterized protein (TIGR02466 family)